MLSSVVFVTVIGKVLGIACPQGYSCRACDRCWTSVAQKNSGGCNEACASPPPSPPTDACTGFPEAVVNVGGVAMPSPHVLQGWVKQTRAKPELVHELMFAVKLKDADRMQEMFFDRSNPTSPNYGKWLSAREADALTMDAVAVQAVRDALIKAGAAVLKTTRGGEFVLAKAPLRLWEDLLQCEFHIYKDDAGDRGTHIAAEAYTIPSPLSDYVYGVLRVQGFPAMRSDSIRISSEVVGHITPELLRTFFKMPVVAKEGSAEAKNREHTTQAAYASLNQHWSPSDLEHFQKTYNLPDRPVHEIDKEYNMSSDSFCKSSPSDCMEANLDVQYMTAMSPWSQTGFFYSANHMNMSTLDTFLADILDLESPPEVISISYTLPEWAVRISPDPSMMTTFNNAAMKLGLRGVTILAASGDDGAQGSILRNQGVTCADLHQKTPIGVVGLQVNWPAASPFVTAVGGTMGVESHTEEVACQINCSVTGDQCKVDAPYVGPLITSGGGYSHYDKPAYQDGHVNCKGRGVPDVSLAAYGYLIENGGLQISVDGTSASSPALAGMISQVNARRKAVGQPSVGFINQVMYQGSKAFNDITKGDNKCGTFNSTLIGKCCGGFDAGPGWDAVTGLGSVDFEKFEALFVRSQVVVV